MAKQSAGGIRAGKAYVELFLKNTLGSGLAKAAAQIKAFGTSVTAVGKSMLAMGAGILAPLGLAAKVFADMGSEMLDLSQRTGASVETLSALGYAASQSGASIEDVAGAVEKMNRNLAQGSSETEDTLTRLGLSLSQLSGMDTDARFLAIAEAIGKIEDPAQRTAAAMQLWGRGAARLLPMLQDLPGLMAEAQRLGIVMSTKDAVAAEAFGDSMSSLWASLKMVVFEIGAALAPALQMIATFLRDAAGAVRQFLAENQGLVIGLAALGAMLIFDGLRLVIIGGVLSALGSIVGAAATAFSVLGTALGILLSPIGLVVAAIAGIGAVLLTQTNIGQTVMGWFSEALAWLGQEFGHLWNTVTQTWGGIVDAVKAGDLGLAFEIAVAGVKLLWAQGWAWISNKWESFKNTFMRGWELIRITVGDVWDGIISTISRTITRLVNIFGWLWKRLTRQTTEGWEEMKARTSAATAEIDRMEDRARLERRVAADARMREREQQGRTNQENVAQAQAELDRLTRQAEWQRWLAEFEREMASWSSRPGTGGREGLGGGTVSTAGTFSSVALSGLGVGRVQDRIASATEETAANTRRLVAAGEAEFS